MAHQKGNVVHMFWIMIILTHSTACHSTACHSIACLMMLLLVPCVLQMMQATCILT